jgi:DnaA regulatory inactivator Hda
MMSKKTEQLPFDLGPRHAHAREDFWVSDCNSAAVAWLDRHDWPALIISGPAASGKTHLLQVWKKETAKEGQAQEITPAQLTPATIERALGLATKAMIDNVLPVIGVQPAEEALFHLYNMLRERGGSLLLTAPAHVTLWPFVLPDLKSRLLAAPSAELGSPDDELMAVVLTKLFSDRQIFVPQEVVQFILPRIERSFQSIRDIADQIDRKALAEKRPVTIPLVKEILQGELRV